MLSGGVIFVLCRMPLYRGVGAFMQNWMGVREPVKLRTVRLTERCGCQNAALRRERAGRSDLLAAPLLDCNVHGTNNAWGDAKGHRELYISRFRAFRCCCRRCCCCRPFLLKRACSKQAKSRMLMENENQPGWMWREPEKVERCPVCSQASDWALKALQDHVSRLRLFNWPGFISFFFLRNGQSSDELFQKWL